jgi:hypothetical protein
MMKTDAQVFDSSHLRPLASLNQRKVITLPGVEASAVGKTGSELLSKKTVLELIRPFQQRLGLDAASSDESPERLNRILESHDQTRVPIVEEIAREYGRRLGWLVASILLSTAGLTSPLDLWEAAYLAQWKMNVDALILGGGMSNGEFGRVIGAQFQRELVQCGIQGKEVCVAEQPSYLALIGAARNLPVGMRGTAVVADFGGTRAKRGLAALDAENALQSLHVLPTRDITALVQGVPEELAEAMVDLIVETLLSAGSKNGLARKALCSVAAYVEDREPMKINRGAYTSLNRVSPRIANWFSERVSQAAGVKVEVDFVRDCDVAACAYAGRPRSAVLMLGSALGVGFVPPAAGYRPLASDFAFSFM